MSNSNGVKRQIRILKYASDPSPGLWIDADAGWLSTRYFVSTLDNHHGLLRYWNLPFKSRYAVYTANGSFEYRPEGEVPDIGKLVEEAHEATRKITPMRVADSQVYVERSDFVCPLAVLQDGDQPVLVNREYLELVSNHLINVEYRRPEGKPTVFVFDPNGKRLLGCVMPIRI